MMHRKKTFELLIAFGGLLFLFGSGLGNSFAKYTLENYFGFGMFLAGIAVIVFGGFGVVLTFLREVKQQKVSFYGVWVIASGLSSFILGSILGNSFAKFTLENNVGGGMLFSGIALMIIGVVGTTVTYVKTYLKGTQTQRTFVVLIAFGVLLFLFGSGLGNSFAKFTLGNYLGFGMLLAGIAAIVFGGFGVVLTFLREVKQQKVSFNGVGFGVTNTLLRERKQQKFSSRGVWVIASGLTLFILGSIMCDSWAEFTLENYSGLGMLLAGIVSMIIGVVGSMAAYAKTYFKSAEARKTFILCVEANNIDSVTDENSKRLLEETETKLLITLDGKDIMAVADLAVILGFSSEVVRNLLHKIISQKKIEGYITKDNEKFISKDYIRRQLSTHLESIYLLDPPEASKEEKQNDSTFSKTWRNQGIGESTLVDPTNEDTMSSVTGENRQPKRREESAVVCPQCKYPMVWQKALHTGELYRRCTNPKPVKGAVAGVCPQCEHPLVWRNSNLTGELYPGCTNYDGGCRFKDRSH